MARLPPITNPETLTISFPGWGASDDCSPQGAPLENSGLTIPPALLVRADEVIE